MMDVVPRSPPPRRDSPSPPRGRSPPPRSRSRSPPGRDRDERGDVNPGNNIYVKNLATRVNEKELEDLFSKYGKVSKCQIMMDPHTRESRGFGFVTLENVDDAEAAISALDGLEYMGKNLSVEKARRGRARTPTPGQYNGPTSRSRYNDRFRSRPYDRPRYDDRRGSYDRERRYDDRDRDRYRRYDDRDRDRGRYNGDRGAGDRDRERRYDDRPPRGDDRDSRRYDDRPRYDRR